MAKKTIKAIKKTTTQHSRQSSSGLESFIQSGEPVTGFNNLPTGHYEGFIIAGSAVLEEKPTGGERAVMFLKVTSPKEFENQEQRKLDDLTSQFGYNLFLGDLVSLGLPEPTSKRELAESLADTDNLKCKFWVGKSDGEFPPKVRINERLEGPQGNEKDEPAEEPSAEYTKEEIDRKCKAEDPEMEDLAKEVGINPDDYTWDELANAIWDAR